MADIANNVDQVRAAFRLGWGISELRGRFRPDLFADPVPVMPAHVNFVRPMHELPLSIERSPDETRIELLKAVQGLATALGLKGFPGVARALTRVSQAAYVLNQDGADVEEDWPGISDRLYSLDAQIQDTLVIQGSEAAAYQLGRGLADTYWALYPDRDGTEMGSWTNVLGEERYDALIRQVLRISPEIGPLVLAAVAGPLEQWRELAQNESRRRAPNVVGALYGQCLLWRDLVRGERQPGDLKQPRAKDVWSDLGIYKSVFLTLRVPILVGLAAAGALIAGAALLASHKLPSGVSTVIALVGAMGLTSAGLYARAKADLTSLLSTVREQVQLERVRRAANECPSPPT